MQKRFFNKIAQPSEIFTFHLNKRILYGTNRPKYAIGFCQKNGYSIVKNTLFGYKNITELSFGGASFINCFDNFQEAKEHLQWWVLAKYLDK